MTIKDYEKAILDGRVDNYQINHYCFKWLIEKELPKWNFSYKKETLKKVIFLEPKETFSGVCYMFDRVLECLGYYCESDTYSQDFKRDFHFQNWDYIRDIHKFQHKMLNHFKKLLEKEQ